MSKNIKGEMATNTIIVLVLGLIVLVALIWGFMTGWSGLKNVLNPSNVDSVKQDCSAACSLGNKYSYCNGDRTLRVNEDDLEVKSSCFVFSSASEFSAYGIESCSQLNCDSPCDSYHLDGTKAEESNAGSYKFKSGTSDCSFNLK